MRAFINNHRILTSSAAALIAFIVVVGALAAVDVRSFSPNDPINWEERERTATGFRESGIVLGYELDCTTGQVRADTPLFDFNVLTVDPPFVAKHKVDEACQRYAWNPQF